MRRGDLEGLRARRDPFPADAAGVTEGQRICRQWSTRQAFRSYDKFDEYAQYAVTPVREFLAAVCSTVAPVLMQPGRSGL